MSNTNVSLESLKKTHGDKAAEVFNEISKLSGAGITASSFDAHDGGIAINEDTPHYAKIKSLLDKKDDKKDGK
jgi:hypothetical protein